MRKYMIKLCLVIGLFSFVACNQVAQGNIASVEATIDTNVTNNSHKTKENDPSKGLLIFRERIQTKSNLPQVNDEKVAESVSRGFESINNPLDIYEYSPLKNDAVQYKALKPSLELSQALTHKGFDSIEIQYERTLYEWNEFFDDLDVTEYPHSITVNLKGNNIFESDIVDDYEKYFRYFNDDKGLYYEVQDLMMGNFTDGSELTNKKIGMVCNYGAIETIKPPSYNPFQLEPDESSSNFYITSLDNKATLYFESYLNNNLHKKWVDIEYGVLVKELVFNSEGLPIEIKKAISITEKNIDDNMFNEPKEIAYRDITMFVFSVSGGSAKELYQGLINTLPNEKKGIRLLGDNGSEITLYYTEIYEGMMGELHLDDVMYISHHTNSKGKKSRIRQIYKKRYYTIHDGLEIVEIVDESSRDKKFFDFTRLGLLSTKNNGEEVIFSFYDPKNISVSGLYDVYEYVIKDESIVKVNTYCIENIQQKEVKDNIISYDIQLIDFDGSVYDEGFADSYKTIDRGEGSFDDGEHMPFWYE